MTRVLLIGGATSALIGASTYFGMGRGWGAPIAVTGVGILALAFGVLAFDVSGPTRWTGMMVALAGVVLVVALTVASLRSESGGTAGGPLVTAIFVIFATSISVFGIVGLISGSIPRIAALILAVGAPLLTAGVWRERLGDLGFVATVSGLVVLGLMSPEGIGA